MSIFYTGARTAQRVVGRVIELPIAELPAFLCPRLLSSIRTPRSTRSEPRQYQRGTLPQRRSLSTIPSFESTSSTPASTFVLQKLPRQCPGCGALTQLVDKEEAGFYTATRKTIKDFLGVGTARDNSTEDSIVQAALKNAGAAAEGLSFERGSKREKQIEPPFCDRCHDIIHHSNGVSIHHPSAAAIQETILESPHKHNHIYHIIDAADFPMSLIPQVQKLLNATPQRSHNRRSKTERYYRGKKIDLSFIITRSDLLAAKKEQVDAMMPYFRDTLRDALGRSARDVRLGNVKCVSAKRQWWTSGLQDEIYQRGGGSWMVGKVNVGKSQLLHEIFPKGRRQVGDSSKGYKGVTLEAREVVDPVTEDGATQTPTEEQEESLADEVSAGNGAPPSERVTFESAGSDETPLSSFGDNDTLKTDFLDSSNLLPPLPQEVDYPTMPLVSSLPGTTASPIRLPFGNGKGEMIDLPGLSRGDLELYVKPEHRSSLVMRSRIEPKQTTLNPGQSLLLGGFIRITPTSPLDFLTYNFTPLDAHRTSTIKAIDIQAQSEEARNIPTIALPEAATKMKLAGSFHLKWDVTKERAGPLTNPNKVGLKPEKLPFKVLATDLLIEGVGWVEIVTQVRKKPADLPTGESGESRREKMKLQELAKPLNTNGEEEDGKVWYSPLGQSSAPKSSPTEDVSNTRVEWLAPGKEPSPNSLLSRKEDDPEEVDANWPSFEVYTPEGRFVATRRPMNAWLAVMSKPKRGGVRPRKSMKGKKKEEKKSKRGW